jgi:choline dehydrogenase
MHADVCIVGAGAAGCVLAARLSEDRARTVVLVEAGPDYGRLEEGRWPAELLDASDCATTHDWGYGVDTCCRVVGGCSAHNGCLVVRGTDDDYDGWARATGDPGWGAAAMRPYLDRAEARIETRTFAPDEVGAVTRRALAGWAELGVARLEDFNAVDAIAGAGLFPVNRRGRIRVSAAIAYLDPARGRANLTILPDALADRVAIRDGSARGVHVRRDGAELLIEADEVILAAGAYGSPAILQRSGVGPAAVLAGLGIPAVADIEAVGQNLQDHPAVDLVLEVGPPLQAELASDDARGALTHVQASLKAASRHCRDGTFDLQLYPNVGWREGGGHFASLIAIQLAPRSRGVVRVRSGDPTDVPVIEQRLFRGDGGHDLEVLLDGVELALALAATRPLAEVVAPPARPAPDEVAARAWTLFHPTGTCAMGTVVDGGCRVAGIDRLRVCDASVFPDVPRANTHLSVLALAEALADRTIHA